MVRKPAGSHRVTTAAAALLTAAQAGGCDRSRDTEGAGPRAVRDDGAPSSILDGVFVHDFGLHAWANDSPLDLRHTFVLTNVSKETLELVKVGRSCGCVVAEPDERSIPPAGTLSLDATLTMANQGTQTQHIQLVFKDGRRQQLTLVGSAREAAGLHFGQGAVDLTTGHESAVDIFLITAGEGLSPPTPDLLAPEGVNVRFTSWIPAIWLPDGHPERYRRWTGRVRLRPDEDWAPDRGSVLLVRQGRLETQLALDGMPTWNSSGASRAAP